MEAITTFTAIMAWILIVLLSSCAQVVSAQLIGGGDENNNANIINGTESPRVRGYVASGPGRCGGQLIHPDIVVSTESQKKSVASRSLSEDIFFTDEY